jgi:hypothetical protein
MLYPAHSALDGAKYVIVDDKSFKGPVATLLPEFGKRLRVHTPQATSSEGRADWRRFKS